MSTVIEGEVVEPGTTSTALTTVDLPGDAVVTATLARVTAFQKLVKATMIAGHDYGVIPGTGTKPTLLKPGAEKITKLLRLADSWEMVERLQDWDKGLFQYIIRIKLTDIQSGALVAEGVGECNSFEPKYRYRQSNHVCPECQEETVRKSRADKGGGWYCWRRIGGCGSTWDKGSQTAQAFGRQTVGKVENEDRAGQINTYLKMAKKRALVDAALSVGRLSDLFTQDLEDGAPPESPAPSPEPSASESNGKPQNGKPAAQRKREATKTKETKQEPSAPPQSASEPSSATGDAQYICADCDRPIERHKLQDGRVIDVASLLKRTMRGFGVELCFACGSKRQTANIEQPDEPLADDEPPGDAYADGL